MLCSLNSATTTILLRDSLAGSNYFINLHATLSFCLSTAQYRVMKQNGNNAVMVLSTKGLDVHM